MNKLLDDENEEDEQFWNQDALKEVLLLTILCTDSVFLYDLFYFSIIVTVCLFK